jgi:hypothetical protein
MYSSKPVALAFIVVVAGAAAAAAAPLGSDSIFVRLLDVKLDQQLGEATEAQPFVFDFGVAPPPGFKPVDIALLPPPPRIANTASDLIRLTAVRGIAGETLRLEFQSDPETRLPIPAGAKPLQEDGTLQNLTTLLFGESATGVPRFSVFVQSDIEEFRGFSDRIVVAENLHFLLDTLGENSERRTVSLNLGPVPAGFSPALVALMEPDTTLASDLVALRSVRTPDGLRMFLDFRSDALEGGFPIPRGARRLVEDGRVQDLTPLLFPPSATSLPPFTIFVRSDVPEPPTAVLVAVGVMVMIRMVGSRRTRARTQPDATLP